MQFHSASYPISAKSPSTFPNQDPRSPASRFGTFSTITYLGRISLTSRTISLHSPLRSPLMPDWAPATDKSWQGNPPVITSTDPLNCSPSNSFTSSYIGTSGQCFLSTFCGNGSISQKATVSKPPVRSRPRLKPPMPENKSKTFNFRSFVPVSSCIIISQSYNKLIALGIAPLCCFHIRKEITFFA